MPNQEERERAARKRVCVACGAVGVFAAAFFIFGHGDAKYHSVEKRERIAAARRTAAIVLACLVGLVIVAYLGWYRYWMHRRQYNVHLSTGEPLPDRFMRNERKAKKEQKAEERPKPSPRRKAPSPVAAARGFGDEGDEMQLLGGGGDDNV
eukprot:TRINITY_DN3163_c1_g1_i1.p3 TRINITY_DN3163_c1_g1~~TRINITY_DN3163_c1_g1_i1.p3  ORF type:complete len:151 (+),score=46.61 TRINITY_DN3163_c1_g1_i1:39-491(+)